MYRDLFLLFINKLHVLHLSMRGYVDVTAADLNLGLFVLLYSLHQCSVPCHLHCVHEVIRLGTQHRKPQFQKRAILA